MTTAMPKSGVRLIFWAAFAASIIILIFVATLGSRWADRLLFGGSRILGGNVGVMVIPIIVLSILFAITACRRLGISADGKDTEVLQRSPQSPVHPMEAVELRIARTLWSGLALLMDVFALMVLLAVYYLPSVPGTQPTGYGIAAFFALFSLGPWYGWHTRSGLIVRVNADGVRAENAGPKSFVPWTQIAACEILTVRDVMGDPAFTRYIFKDADGEPLMTVATLSASNEDRARLRRAVGERFLGNGSSGGGGNDAAS